MRVYLPKIQISNILKEIKQKKAHHLGDFSDFLSFGGHLRAPGGTPGGHCHLFIIMRYTTTKYPSNRTNPKRKYKKKQGEKA